MSKRKHKNYRSFSAYFDHTQHHHLPNGTLINHQELCKQTVSAETDLEILAQQIADEIAKHTTPTFRFENEIMQELALVAVCEGNFYLDGSIYHLPEWT